MCLWNVNGLARHLQDSDACSVFTSADIFVLTETRMVEKEIYIDGFDCVHAPHITKVHKRPTASTGGVLVGIKKDLVHAVIECSPMFESSFVYVKLNGLQIGFPAILHVVCTYMPHRQSTHYDSQRWDRMQAFIDQLPQHEGVILLGDMNARIGSDCPQIRWHGQDIDVDRTSHDCDTNETGHRFMSLCNTLNLLPLNGLHRDSNDVFDASKFSEAYCCIDILRA